MAKRPSRRHAASDSELLRTSGGVLNADADVDVNPTLNLGSVLDGDRNVVNKSGSTHNSGLNVNIDLRESNLKRKNKKSSGGDS